MKKPLDPGGSCLLPALKLCSWQFPTHPTQLQYGSFSASRKMLNFDSAECKTEDFEIILPASVSSRDLRYTVTLQFETDTMMVIAQAQTRPIVVSIPASFSINGNQVQMVDSTAKDGAGSSCFRITCLVNFLLSIQTFSDLLILLQKDYTQLRWAYDYTKSTPGGPVRDGIVTVMILFYLLQYMVVLWIGVLFEVDSMLYLYCLLCCGCP
ncbi:hypothetical protein Cgig2_012393 [Carnegiea gigantea]|uniref:Uncharacterized protein n=1 Tax=Carnegiea gigantea TaxID=171969 RepID=A0A9Q1GZ89_9CARY|nr:hypothetical protein Cgig2_012393 [Carnegiea gigantea]